MIHLSGLDRFLAAAQAGSLNRAAERLHISQPTLTKSIRMLEERLGVELFVRGARGVTLTTYGKAVLMRARLIDAEMRKIAQDIEALQDSSLGSVNVGAPPGAGFHTSTLPAVTLRLISGGRQLSVNYSMGTREQLLPSLREGGLDFIIGVIANDDGSDDLVQLPLFENRNCVVVRRGHPLVDRWPVGYGELLAFPWLKCRAGACVAIAGAIPGTDGEPKRGAFRLVAAVEVGCPGQRCGGPDSVRREPRRHRFRRAV